MDEPKRSSGPAEERELALAEFIEEEIARGKMRLESTPWEEALATAGASQENH